MKYYEDIRSQKVVDRNGVCTPRLFSIEHTGWSQRLTRQYIQDNAFLGDAQLDEWRKDTTLPSIYSTKGQNIKIPAKGRAANAFA